MRVHESPESASPSVTRAVAAALTGERFQALALPPWQRLALAGLDRLAPSVIPTLVGWENRRRALPLRAAEMVNIDDLAADRVQDYDGWSGPVEAIVLGSSLGGAAAYLASALGAPFLPEPFILGFQGGAADGELEPHFRQAIQLGEIVEENNPAATLISHFDPIHDGWLTGFLNHLRLKLRAIPAAYQRLIRQNLRPGGTLLHLNCQAKWLSFPISRRHRYQIGGWGAISPQEFLQGSQRIDRFLEQTDSLHRGGWRPPGVEASWSSESEWGSEPEFAEALQAWAASNGYRYQSIDMASPHHYSALAYFALEALFKKSGLAPQAVLVGMFNQYDPGAVLTRGLLPLWLVFNTTDSLEFLGAMSQEFPQTQVLFAALVTYSQTPDMVPWSQWAEALQGVDWRSIGARPDRYPADTVALWQWQERLAQHVKPLPGARNLLSVDEILKQVRRIEAWPGLFPGAPAWKTGESGL